jgi:hypothetical protein
MTLSPCFDAFVLAVLCSNPIMKGAFVTILTGTILTIDQDISIFTAQLGRLNIVNQILNLEIQAVQAILNKVQADLNLILEPLAAFGECPELARLNETLQNNAVSKKLSTFQKKIYEYNRIANLTVVQDAITKKKNALRNDLLDMIDRINILCP